MSGLPNNPEFERMVLGAMMVNNLVIPDVMDLLRAENFYVSRHSKVFRAIKQIHEADEPVDQVTVLEAMGGSEMDPEERVAVVSMAGDAPTGSARIVHYANRVRQLWAQRELMVRAQGVQDLARSPEEDFDEVIALAERLPEGLELARGEFIGMAEAVDEAAADIAWARENPGQIRGLPTGIPKLDQMLSGVQGSNYYILAGRPSEGKTQTGLVVAREAAKHGHVLFVSLEMPAKALSQRMLTAEVNVDSQALTLGMLSQDAMRRVHRGYESLKGLPIDIYDEPGLTADDVRAAVRKSVRKHGTKLVVVDYLQLVQPPRGVRGDSRDENVANTSRMMKRIAREHDVAMLVLAQLSRGVMQRADKRPILNDLRESGSIEQDADIVMMLYHPHKHEQVFDNRMEILVRKQRNGPTGMVLAYFDPASGRIGEFSYQRETF